MNWGHAQILGLYHTMFEVGTPTTNNLGMVRRPVSGTHTTAIVWDIQDIKQ